MAQIYKTFTKTDLANKGTTPATTTQKQAITQILNNFIVYFKLKHM